MSTPLKPQLHKHSVICRFLCKIGLHNWKHIKGVINKYYECKWCESRKVIENEFVYQPIDRDWLNKQPDSFNYTPPSF